MPRRGLLGHTFVCASFRLAWEVILEKGIQRLVVVSSASVSRPYAPVGLLLNTLLGRVKWRDQSGESTAESREGIEKWKNDSLIF